MTVRIFGFRFFLVRKSYVGVYVLWGAQGDNGQSRRVAMGLLMATEAGSVWSGMVWSCPVRSGCWGGRRGVVGGRGRSFWLEYGPVWDALGWCLLPMKMGGRALPATLLVSGGHRGSSRGHS